MFNEFVASFRGLFESVKKNLRGEELDMEELLEKSTSVSLLGKTYNLTDHAGGFSGGSTAVASNTAGTSDPLHHAVTSSKGSKESANTTGAAGGTTGSSIKLGSGLIVGDSSATSSTNQPFSTNPNKQRSSLQGNDAQSASQRRDQQIKRFQKVFLTRYVFTYRHSIEGLGGGSGPPITSDQGWGCMLRVMQMCIAQCLEDIKKFDLSYFDDRPEACLGIHKFCWKLEELYRKPVGSWFGPTSSAVVAAKLINSADIPLRGVAFEDGPIYEDEITSGTFPCVAWVCRKLGVVPLNNPVPFGPRHEIQYRKAIEALFGVPGFMGIGSGNDGVTARYFVGTTSKHLLYLDPHCAVLPALLPREDTEVQMLDVHQRAELVKTCCGKLAWESLNASLNLTFIIRSAEDWDAMKQAIGRIPEGLDLIEILKTKPTFAELDDIPDLDTDTLDGEDMLLI